jgi:hypothetical protein
MQNFAVLKQTIGVEAVVFKKLICIISNFSSNEHSNYHTLCFLIYTVMLGRWVIANHLFMRIPPKFGMNDYSLSTMLDDV